MLESSDWSRSDTLALWALIISGISVAIAVGIPAITSFKNRPQIKLFAKWRHQPGDPDIDGKEDMPWQPMQKETYYCDFQILNAGSTANQINEVKVSGKSEGSVEVALSNMIIGGGGNFLDLPKQLAPGQSFRFTYWFTPTQFEAMRTRKHFLVVQAQKTHWLRIHTTL
jgi:hypothetical protein